MVSTATESTAADAMFIFIARIARRSDASVQTRACAPEREREWRSPCQGFLSFSGQQKHPLELIRRRLAHSRSPSRARQSGDEERRRGRSSLLAARHRRYSPPAGRCSHETKTKKIAKLQVNSRVDATAHCTYTRHRLPGVHKAATRAVFPRRSLRTAAKNQSARMRSPTCGRVRRSLVQCEGNKIDLSHQWA